ncbi:MAG: cation-translocating P-type ATPase [Campylobacter sp.]|nr:cation-translocating P-type ATPase [Campylobacter sp.]
MKHDHCTANCECHKHLDGSSKVASSHPSGNTETTSTSKDSGDDDPSDRQTPSNLNISNTNNSHKSCQCHNDDCHSDQKSGDISQNCQSENKHNSHENSCCCSSKEALKPKKDLKIPKGYVLDRYFIGEMDCPTEEKIIKNALKNHPDIYDMDFNLIKQIFIIVHKKDSNLDIPKEISKLGMRAELLNDESGMTNDAQKSKKEFYLKILPALILAFSAEILHWFFELLSASFDSAFLRGAIIAFSLIAIVLSGIGTYYKGLISIKNKILNINALMSIAVTGAFILGEFPEAAMVMSLYALSEWIEAKSLQKARDALGSLLALTPDKCEIKRDGKFKEILVKEAVIDDIVRIKPGEKIALDGKIISGSSTLNQAAITGESMPILKDIGDEIFAGSVNENGSFEYKVTSLAKDSMMAKIIKTVEEATSKKAKTERLVDKFASIYTPLAVLFALCVAIIPPIFTGEWLSSIHKGLTILVISCPCAFVIATPVTVVSALRSALKMGVIVKGGVYVESSKNLKKIAFDKTGTITHGKPFLTDNISLKPNSLMIAASLAKRSDHPISKALSQAYDGEIVEINEFKAILGKGTSGLVNGNTYYLASPSFINELGLMDERIKKQISSLENNGKTVVALAKDGEILGIYGVADTIKENSIQAIKSLKEMGIKTIMLTGDNEVAARQIATKAGVDEFRAKMLPDDKLKAIDELKSGLKDGKLVAMVGDGINDAPALAKADVSFAMGKLGSQSAIEIADITVMDDNLGKIVDFIKLSKHTYNVLWQNIGFAIGVKIFFLIITVLGFGTMTLAILADVGTSLLVIANGLRISKKKFE